jgi:hypothetical protein
MISFCSATDFSDKYVPAKGWIPSSNLSSKGAAKDKEYRVLVSSTVAMGLGSFRTLALRPRTFLVVPLVVPPFHNLTKHATEGGAIVPTFVALGVEVHQWFSYRSH